MRKVTSAAATTALPQPNGKCSFIYFNQAMTEHFFYAVPVNPLSFVDFLFIVLGL